MANIYKSGKALSKYTLRNGDHIIFNFKGIEYTYIVTGNYLNSNTGDNSVLFNKIKESIPDFDKYKFASISYGYPTGSGNWPTSRTGDRKGLKQMCIDLFTLIETLELKEKSDPIWDWLEDKMS